MIRSGGSLRIDESQIKILEQDIQTDESWKKSSHLQVPLHWQTEYRVRERFIRKRIEVEDRIIAGTRRVRRKMERHRLGKSELVSDPEELSENDV